MGRTKPGVTGRRPYWTAEEDSQLVRLVTKYGTKNWGVIAKELQSPVQRKGKSCRSRWMHQLNPCIKHSPFSAEEERVLVSKQREYGNKWSKIAAFLPGRTDNAIKNHWHGHVKRRVLAPSRSHSSSNDDLLEVKFRDDDGWMDVDKPRRTNRRVSKTPLLEDVECANILLQLSKSHDITTRKTPTPETLPRQSSDFDFVSVKLESPFIPEEESESSRETNNDCSLHPEGGFEFGGQSDDRILERSNNTSEIIQPTQQKLLSDTLESVGLAHYPILHLCPIKEEDINSEEHVVIILQSEDKKPSNQALLIKTEEQDQLMQEQDHLVQEQDQLMQEQDHLMQEQDHLVQEQVQFREDSFSDGGSVCVLPVSEKSPAMLEWRSMLDPRSTTRTPPPPPRLPDYPSFNSQQDQFSDAVCSCSSLAPIVDRLRMDSCSDWSFLRGKRTECSPVGAEVPSSGFQKVDLHRSLLLKDKVDVFESLLPAEEEGESLIRPKREIKKPRRFLEIFHKVE